MKSSSESRIQIAIVYVTVSEEENKINQQTYNWEVKPCQTYACHRMRDVA